MSGPTIVFGKLVFRQRRAGLPGVRRPGLWRDRSDELSAARGVLTGLGIGIGMWSLILAAALSTRFI